MSDYHRLPIAQKRAADLARVREPAVTCPICDTQVMPTDLLAHLEQRCPGQRAPGPGSEWVTWHKALALGVKRSTLSRWVKDRLVRYAGARQDRKYLKRDLVLQIAKRMRNPVGTPTDGSEE